MPTTIPECAEDVMAPRETGGSAHARIPGSRPRALPATGHRPRPGAPGAAADALLGLPDRTPA